MNVWLDNDPGDYLLIDETGQIQAVSGNSEFWDLDETMPSIQPTDQYVIVKVISRRRNLLVEVTRDSECTN
jgi:hypothetical protein